MVTGNTNREESSGEGRSHVENDDPGGAGGGGGDDVASVAFILHFKRVDDTQTFLTRGADQHIPAFTAVATGRVHHLTQKRLCSHCLLLGVVSMECLQQVNCHTAQPLVSQFQPCPHKIQFQLTLLLRPAELPPPTALCLSLDFTSC